MVIVDQDVVKTYGRPDAEFNEEVSERCIQSIWEHVKDKRIFNLLVAHPTTHVTVNVSHYSNDDYEAVKRAEAMVISSLAHRMLVKFYIKSRKLDYPMMVFDTEKKALKWFDELRQAGI